jgi:hypothetical protein
MIVFASWLKHRQETDITSNLIALISPIETIGIFAQAIQAYELGIFSTFGLSLISLLFLVGSNLFFFLNFLKQVQGVDRAFMHWSVTFKRTRTAIMLLGATLNFKVFRLIYSKLFNL